MSSITYKELEEGLVPGGRILVVTGGKGVNVNGSFLEHSNPYNKKPCFIRQGGGSIYFDGTYWKICQTGYAWDYQGWNYSQRPFDDEVDFDTPPLGKWSEARATHESKVDYSEFEVEINQNNIKG